MGEKRAFAEILAEKMGPPPRKSDHCPRVTLPMAWEIAPTFAAHLHTFAPTKNPYPKVSRPHLRIVKPQQPPPLAWEKSITFWQLTTAEQQAFRNFVELGGRLAKDQLTVKKIKKEYRRLAKTLHPDANAGVTSHNFIRLKNSESVLTRAVVQLLGGQQR